MQEPLPLATIQASVFEFLRGREDVALFGAQAVNAYVHEPRMTQDIDLIALHAAELAQELRDYLSQRFYVAIRVREVKEGQGFRLYQVQKSGNRHLVDIRQIALLPSTQQIAQMLVVAPLDLIAMKVIAYQQRRGQPKAGTDWRDLAMLLLTFPQFKQDPTLVTEQLRKLEVPSTTLTVWQELAQQPIEASEEDDF